METILLSRCTVTSSLLTARRPSLLIKLRFVIDTARRPRELFLLEGAIHGAGKRRPAGHCGRRLLPRRKQTAAGGPLWPPAAALVWGLNRGAADPGVRDADAASSASTALLLRPAKFRAPVTGCRCCRRSCEPAELLWPPAERKAPLPAWLRAGRALSGLLRKGG